MIWINGVKLQRYMPNNRPGVEYFRATAVDIDNSVLFTASPFITMISVIGLNCHGSLMIVNP